MDTTRTSVSHMGLEDPDTADNSKEANMRKAIRLFAQISTAVAADFRSRKGQEIIDPDLNLGFCENFFHMCFGKVPSPEVVKAFDVSMTLYAEHSFNASTFTSRVIASSLSDMHGAVTGAIASLKGPLHTYPFPLALGQLGFSKSIIRQTGENDECAQSSKK